jgi:hypothetical protein
MKNKALSGITFSVDNDKISNNIAVDILKCVAGLVGLLILSISVFNMLEIKMNIACAIIPCVIIILEYLLNKRDKIYSWFNIALIIVLVLLIFINLSDFINGAKIIFNQIFEISEKYQAYLYNRFDVTVDEGSYDKCRAFFMLSVLTAISTLMSYSAIKGHSFVILIVAIATAIFEMYFGIAPSLALNFIFFAVMILLAVIIKLNSTEVIAQGVAIFVAISLVFGAVSFAIYPANYSEPISAVYQLSENIRDVFDDGEQAISNQLFTTSAQGDTSNPESSQLDDGDLVQTEQGNDNSAGGNKKHASNATTVSVNFVTVIVIMLLIVAIFVWLLLILFFSIKRRKALSNKDNKKVISFALMSSLKWLSAYGLKLKNTVPSDYVEPIGELVSSDYAGDYSLAVEIWQEAIYSDNQISDIQRQEVINFYNQTKKLIFKKSNVIKKFKIKFIKLM